MFDNPWNSKAYWIRILFRLILGRDPKPEEVQDYLRELEDLTLKEVQNGISWICEDPHWRLARILPLPEAIREGARWKEIDRREIINEVLQSPNAFLERRLKINRTRGLREVLKDWEERAIELRKFLDNWEKDLREGRKHLGSLMPRFIPWIWDSWVFWLEILSWNLFGRNLRLWELCHYLKALDLSVSELRTGVLWTLQQAPYYRLLQTLPPPEAIREAAARASLGGWRIELKREDLSP